MKTNTYGENPEPLMHWLRHRTTAYYQIDLGVIGNTPSVIGPSNRRVALHVALPRTANNAVFISQDPLSNRAGPAGMIGLSTCQPNCQVRIEDWGQIIQ